MRMLNVHTQKLEEFDASDRPPYAILSHTWEKGQEVTYAEWSERSSGEKKGYAKIAKACGKAAADGLSYIWIDSCCIDKASSAELSEAINSMYSWYQDAERCYAYLSDFDKQHCQHQENQETREHSEHQGRQEAEQQQQQQDNSKNQELYSIESLEKCRWWTRGWTLQELLAPREVEFFDRHWEHCFSRAGQSRVISAITGIDEDVLLGRRSLFTASIAKRMSWMAARRTTRPEDVAYCLLGLFDVNMSMIYGEGAKAFIRLQEEIIKYSDDQSIFAWTYPESPESPAAADEELFGLLAPSPACFRDSADVVPFVDLEADSPFQVGNKGMSIMLRLSRVWGRHYRAELCCKRDSSFRMYNKSICIFLQRLHPRQGHYARVRPRGLVQHLGQGKLERVYVRQAPRRPSGNNSGSITNLSDHHSAVPKLHVELRDGPAAGDTAAGYRVWRVCICPASDEAGAADLEGLLRRQTAGGWIPAGEPIRWRLPQLPGGLVGVIIFKASRRCRPPPSSASASASSPSLPRSNSAAAAAAAATATATTSTTASKSSSTTTAGNSSGDYLWIVLGSTWEHGLCFDVARHDVLPLNSQSDAAVLALVRDGFVAHAPNTVLQHRASGCRVELFADWRNEPWGTSCLVDVRIDDGADDAAWPTLDLGLGLRSPTA